MEKLLIEKYFEKGWLKFGNPQISADIKLMAGLRFYGDYLEAENKHSLGVQNYILERIDGGEKIAFQEKHLLKSGRFIKVLKKIPPQYKSVLIETVLENKERRFLKENYVHALELFKENLCLALDCLFEIYVGKTLENRPEIKGYAVKNFWENA